MGPPASGRRSRLYAGVGPTAEEYLAELKQKTTIPPSQSIRFVVLLSKKEGAFLKEKLTPRQLTLIGSMLFGLFFGAGNLIFPLILGAKAGQNLPAALLGLLITAVGLVISCAGTFETMFPGKLSYPRRAVVFSGASLLISNFGLSRIIEFSAPLLYFLYPWPSS